jgi:hypothetical protein
MSQARPLRVVSYEERSTRYELGYSMVEGDSGGVALVEVWMARGWTLEITDW